MSDSDSDGTSAKAEVVAASTADNVNEAGLRNRCAQQATRMRKLPGLGVDRDKMTALNCSTYCDAKRFVCDRDGGGAKCGT